MSISSVTNTSTISTAYSNSAKNYQQNESGNVNKVSNSDQVTLSMEGKLMAATRQFGVGQELIAFTLKPEFRLADTTMVTGIKIGELLKEEGVPEQTHVTVSRDGSGKIDYAVKHPDGEKIAKALSEDTQLTQHIEDIHAAMLQQRTDKAANGLFDGIPESNVDARNRATEWLQEFTKQSQSYAMMLSYSGEAPFGSLADGNGSRVDYMNNFTVPKFT